MTITKERKNEIIKDNQKDATDTGSPEVQIAVLTTRINNLTEHMRAHPKIIRPDEDCWQWLADVAVSLIMFVNRMLSATSISLVNLVFENRLLLVARIQD